MHIAFVTPESPYGDELGCGIAAYLGAIVPALADAGHRVTVIANAKEEKVFEAEKGRVSVHHFRLPSLHWYFARLPLIKNLAPLPLRQLEWSRAFYRQAAKVAASKPIDVIESTETGSLFLNRIAPLVIRLHGSERSFREHSGRPVNVGVRWNDSLEALACKRAAAVTSPSEFHAQQIARRRAWRSGRVRVIPNPVSSQILQAANEFKKNGNKERVVLYAGRLAPVKGIESLLAAARLVQAADPSIRFVLAGPWQMPKPPEAYGLELNHKTSEGICWVGPQQQAQVIAWYKRASVVVAPSLYESFGITAIEAMAFGVPVIATDAGALPELLPGAGLVPKNDHKALAKAVTRVFSGNSSAATEDLRRHVFESYAPARSAAKTVELYESLVR